MTSGGKKKSAVLETLFGIISMGHSPAGLIYYLFRRKKLTDLETTFVSRLVIEFLGLGSWIITIIVAVFLFRFLYSG